jgi:hypothetical protein
VIATTTALPGKSFTGSAMVAAADFNGDDKAEPLVGNGAGRAPRVRPVNLNTFTTTGAALSALEIHPFDPGNRRGLAKMYDAHVMRFQSLTAYNYASVNALVDMAVKDMDADDLASGDLKGEIITGQGPGSSLHLGAWQPDATMIDDILEDGPDFLHGFFIA